MRNRRAYTREERLHQIQVALAVRQRDTGKRFHSVASIARLLDMRPSTHLRSMFTELVNAGVLAVEELPGVGNVAVNRAYALRTEMNSYFHSTTPRTISMRSRGVTTQERLF